MALKRGTYRQVSLRLNLDTHIELEAVGKGLVWAAYDQNDDELGSGRFPGRVPTAEALAADINDTLAMDPPLAPAMVARKLHELARALVKRERRGGKARASTGPRPVSGYAYRNVEDDDWRGSSDDVWETIMYTPTGNEKLLGERHIDGARVRVFRMDDGWYVAQTAVATGGKPRKSRKTLCKKKRTPTWVLNMQHYMDAEKAAGPRRKRHVGGKRRARGAGLIAAAKALKDVWR